MVRGRGACERTAHEPGRASSPLENSPAKPGAPETNIPHTPSVRARTSGVAKNKAPRRGRPKARETVAEAEGDETSEGCIRATKPGNGWPPEPAEQRRPVSGTSLRRERCPLPRWRKTCHRNDSR